VENLAFYTLILFVIFLKVNKKREENNRNQNKLRVYKHLNRRKQKRVFNAFNGKNGKTHSLCYNMYPCFDPVQLQ